MAPLIVNVAFSPAQIVKLPLILKLGPELISNTDLSVSDLQAPLIINCTV